MTPLILNYLASSQYDTAASLCEQAIEEAPQHLAYYWYLGLVRLLQQEQAEAEAVWLSAMTEADPLTVEVGLEELLQILQAEADRQLELSQPHLSEAILWQALALNADRASLYVQLGNAIALQGRLDEAIEQWQAAIEQQPDCVEAYFQQAAVFQKLEQWDEAIAAYAQVIALQPGWQVHYQLGLCLAIRQRWQEAIDQFNQVIQLQPDFAAAWGDRGWAHLQTGNWQQAIADLQTAIQEKSAYAQTYSTWAKLLSAHKTTQERADFLRLLCLPDRQQIYEALIQWVNRHTKVSAISATPLTPLPVTIAALDCPDYSLTNDLTNNDLNDDRNSPCLDSSPGYYETTKAWAEGEVNCECYVELDAPSVIALKAPQTIDPSVHFSFRFGQEMPLPGTFVATIPDGQFWLNAQQTSSAVWTADRQLLGDLSPEFPLLSPGHPDRHPKYHSSLLQPCFRSAPKPVQKVNGTVAVIAGLANDMYFHWLFDVLPRIDLLQRSGIAIDSIDYFLVNNQLPFQQETLRRLGIPDAKILNTTEQIQSQHIQADRLIVPSYPSSPAWMSHYVCQWLRTVFLSQDKTQRSKGDRIYITRQQTSNRRIINESAVVEFLNQFNFQCIALESLSVVEQAALLANAEVVIAPHGGGLTNTVFCQPGTKIIEIFSPHYVYPCYWLISNLVNLNYYYLTGIFPEGHCLHHFLYPDARIADIWVDLDDLKYTLMLAEVI